MNDFGLDANSIQGKSALTITSYDEVYIINGEVRIPEIIGRFSRMVDTYRSQGLNGLRAGAEMSCFLKLGKVEELLAYENALHRKFAFQAEGICAYNLFEMNNLGFLDLFMPLVRAHDPVIFASPNGYLIMKPEKVQTKHAEMMLAS